MFVHKFKYTLKILLKKRMLLFWTFAFPICLGTFFMMAFSDIEKGETLDIIDIAIVNNKDYQQNEIYKTVFKKLSDKNNEDRLFHTVYVKENKAKKLLEDKKISGYLIFHEQKPTVVIQTNGINETIFNQVVTEIESQKDIYHPYQKHHSTVKDACVIGNEMHVENLILYHSEDDNLLDRKRLYQEEGSFYQGHLYIPDDLEMIEI